MNIHMYTYMYICVFVCMYHIFLNKGRPSAMLGSANWVFIRFFNVTSAKVVHFLPGFVNMNDHTRI